MKVWIERVHPKDPKEDRLWQELLKKVNNRLAVNEIPVLDAGVKLSDFHSRKAESGKCAGVYRDRWPVEQIPLAAKQMVGAHRQFVHARESIQRLPERALLAGSLLSFLAATAPAVATYL